MKLKLIFGILGFLFVVSTNAQVHYLHIENEDKDNKYADGTQVVEKALVKYFLNKPEFSIVERNALDVIEKERMTQRNESFMEGHYVAQNKSVGASYLLTYLYHPFNKRLLLKFLNVTTNETLHKENLDLERFLNKDNKIERPDYFERYIMEYCINLTKNIYLDDSQKIKVMEVVLQKKDKAEQVLIACEGACVMKAGSEYIISIKEATKVTGVFVDKTIGKIKVIKIHTPTSATAIVIEGQGEVVKNLNSQNEISCASM